MSACADPKAAARLAQSLSDWPDNNAELFAQVQKRLNTFVARGQLGIFSLG